MNSKAEILALARTLMNQHGLSHWKVQFINSHTVAGLCWTYRWNANPAFSAGRIELSWPFFEVWGEFDIRDTILHEIAHALTPTPLQKTKTGRTRHIHHGAEWKAMAKKIGCSGERCVREGAPKPKGRYVGICPNGHESTRQRLTWNAKHATSCSKCDSKTFNARYMFDWYDRGVLIHSQKAHKGPTQLAPTQPVLNVTTVPVMAGAKAHVKDISDWDRQAELIKEILKQKV